MYAGYKLCSGDKSFDDGKTAQVRCLSSVLRVCVDEVYCTDWLLHECINSGDVDMYLEQLKISARMLIKIIVFTDSDKTWHWWVDCWVQVVVG
jgi:hypothetical protein